LVHSPKTGNAGDRLIERAAEQLCDEFALSWRVVEPDSLHGCEVLLLFGGGNYGHRCCWLERRRRAQALASGAPCVLLPQTAYGVEEGLYAQTFARDRASLVFLPGATLAPDLALFYRPAQSPPVICEQGKFFTTSPEGLWRGRGVDPRHLFGDPDDYLAYVGAHRRIVTDCLHVAICGLIAGREVTLLPTRLHKQRSVWEAWLRRLGCRWADAPPA